MEFFLSDIKIYFELFKLYSFILFVFELILSELLEESAVVWVWDVFLGVVMRLGEEPDNS